MSIFVVLEIVFYLWILIMVLGCLYLTRGMKWSERYNAFHNIPRKNLIEKYGEKRIKLIRNFMYFTVFLLVAQLILAPYLINYFSPPPSF